MKQLVSAMDDDDPHNLLILINRQQILYTKSGSALKYKNKIITTIWWEVELFRNSLGEIIIVFFSKAASKVWVSEMVEKVSRICWLYSLKWSSISYRCLLVLYIFFDICRTLCYNSKTLSRRKLDLPLQFLVEKIYFVFLHSVWFLFEFVAGYF